MFSFFQTSYARLMFFLTPCGASYATLMHETINDGWIFSLGSVVIHIANVSWTSVNSFNCFSSDVNSDDELKCMFFRTTHFGCLHSVCSVSSSLIWSSPMAISMQFVRVTCLANIRSSSDGSDPIDVIIILGSVLSSTNLERFNVGGDKSVSSKFE